MDNEQEPFFEMRRKDMQNSTTGLGRRYHTIRTRMLSKVDSFLRQRTPTDKIDTSSYAIGATMHHCNTEQDGIYVNKRFLRLIRSRRFWDIRASIVLIAMKKWKLIQVISIRKPHISHAAEIGTFKVQLCPTVLGFMKQVETVTWPLETYWFEIAYAPQVPHEGYQLL